MSVNKAIILGNVGKDPELKYTQNGSAVLNMTIATSNKWTGKDGQKHDETTWHNVVVWGKQAEVVHQYFHKGDQIFIEGRVENRNFDKACLKCGEIYKRYVSEIVMTSFSFVGGKKDQGDSQSSSPQQDNSPELPF